MKKSSGFSDAFRSSPFRLPNGFTLAELIVVVTILTILATVGFVSLGGYASDARNSTRMADVNSLVKVAELTIVTQGKYPEPANATTVTWGIAWNVIFKQGVANSSVFRDLSSRFGAGTNSGAYTYSALADGSAYQVAAEYEGNPPFSYAIDAAYAATKSAYVQGSYVLDPNMPSIIVVPGSVPGTASGWLFSSDVCFVTNGGANLPNGSSSGCAKKSTLTLWKADANLVAYWDMENWYQASYSGTANVVFLKDMSGNWFDMYGRSGPLASINYLTSTDVAAGNIFDKNGDVWVKTMTGTFHFTFNTIDSDYSATTPIGKPIPKEAFYTETTASGSKILPWLSFESKVSFDRTAAVGWNIKRIISWSKDNVTLIESWDVRKIVDSSPLRLNWTGLHSYIVPYNYGTLNAPYGMNWLFGCGWNWCDGSHSITDTDASFSGELLLNSVFNFSAKTNCTYVNGRKFNCSPLSDRTISRIQEAGYQKTWMSLSSISEPFAGTIRSVSVMARALPETEIRQHAITSWF